MHFLVSSLQRKPNVYLYSETCGLNITKPLSYSYIYIYVQQYYTIIVHWRQKLYSVQCTVYSVQCTMYSVQCTMYSVQCVPN